VNAAEEAMMTAAEDLEWAVEGGEKILKDYSKKNKKRPAESEAKVGQCWLTPY